MAKADPASGTAGALLKAGGQFAGTLEKVQGALDSGVEIFAKKILPGASAETTGKLADLIRSLPSGTIGGAISAAVGHAIGGPIGGMIGGGAGAFGAVAELVGTSLKARCRAARMQYARRAAHGETDHAYYGAVAAKTSGIISAIASKIDQGPGSIALRGTSCRGGLMYALGA